REIRADPDKLLERADGEPLVLGVGEVLPFSFARRRAASLPVDVSRTLESVLCTVALDLVHVHDPFQPSAASTALRHSRALNVGHFHAPTERILSTQLTRPLSRLLFGRLDARAASYRSTRELMQRFFPAEYRVILPAADDPSTKAAGHALVMIAREERAARDSPARAGRPRRTCRLASACLRGTARRGPLRTRVRARRRADAGRPARAPDDSARAG